jgi:hypothetical protein
MTSKLVDVLDSSVVCDCCDALRARAWHAQLMDVSAACMNVDYSNVLQDMRMVCNMGRGTSHFHVLWLL